MVARRMVALLLSAVGLFLLAAGINERARVSSVFHRLHELERARDVPWRWAPFNVIVYFTRQSACQTNTLICTHPVHCGAYRGAPREHRRLPVNTFHLLFSSLLFFPFLSPFLSLLFFFPSLLLLSVLFPSRLFLCAFHSRYIYSTYYLFRCFFCIFSSKGGRDRVLSSNQNPY